MVLPFDVEQARRDWDEADQEALAESAKFDEVAGKPKIVCFRVKRILDLTIKEPLGPDMQPKWPIENYMANPNNFVRPGALGAESARSRAARHDSQGGTGEPGRRPSGKAAASDASGPHRPSQVSMVYPPDCVSKSDQYHYEIRLAKLRFVKCAALRRRTHPERPPSRAALPRAQPPSPPARHPSPNLRRAPAPRPRIPPPRPGSPSLPPSRHPAGCGSHHTDNPDTTATSPPPLRRRWFIIPIYRLEMRYLPDRGLLARSWTVVLEQETLPVRFPPAASPPPRPRTSSRRPPARSQPPPAKAATVVPSPTRSRRRTS